MRDVTTSLPVYGIWPNRDVAAALRQTEEAVQNGANVENVETLQLREKKNAYHDFAKDKSVICFKKMWNDLIIFSAKFLEFLPQSQI